MVLANVLFCFSVVTLNLTVYIKDLKILYALYDHTPCTDLKHFTCNFVFTFTLAFSAIEEKHRKQHKRT